MRKIDVKHLLIRLSILIGIPAITLVFAFYFWIPPKDEVQIIQRAYAGIYTVIQIFREIFVMMAILVLETIWLQIRKKVLKRNANLIIIALFVVLMIILQILIYYF